MPCMVVIMGYGARRSQALTEDEMNLKTSSAKLAGGCPTCAGGRAATFNRGSPLAVSLGVPGTTEMYVLSFSGDDDDDAEFNAKQWLLAEHDWLDRGGKQISTFRY